jgi:uncharacterized membrane protein
MLKLFSMTLIPLSLTATFAQAAGAPGYKCAGTEPFWSAEVQGSLVSVSSPDASPQGYSTRKYAVASSEGAAGVTPETATQVIGNRTVRVRGGGTANQKVTVSIIHAGASGCSDGMSDETYSHHALIKESNGPLLYGCCNSK